ncbi:DUF3017 domain-containing protein [Streptomyces triticagri]|uniref:DUF3017 domain-containing protein n=1 Tax=Streptomyces triticagri TaxID=2293568 RepID=UPI0026875A9C|nr:DUF3017 domain-containing protein [Streptomyces triticagri]
MTSAERDGGGAAVDAEQAGDTSGTDSGTDSGADTDTDSGTGAADSGASEGAGDGAKGVVSAPGPGGPRRRSRRFPRITRDTARPEGGGRAASGDAPAPARQWPMLTVLTITGLGLLITATGVFRVGTILIGVALLTGAVMRRVLPSVGMLAVRSRFTDMVTYGVLGVAITLLALMAQPNPVLEIPFLDDTLHFTISS